MDYPILLTFAMLLEASFAAPHPERVVYPKLLEARGANGEKILHIEDGLVLTLEKSTVLAENFILTQDDGQIQHEFLMDGKELERNVYHDRRHMSAISIEEVDGSWEVTGVLSDELRIEPLPLAPRSEEGNIAHKVSRIEKSANYENDYLVAPDSVFAARSASSSQVEARVPQEVFVEVKICVDHYHAAHFKRNKDMLIYLTVSMVAVNLRYEVLENPRVQFRLTGVGKMNDSNVVTTVRDGVPYLVAEATIETLARQIYLRQIEVMADVLLFVTELDMVSFARGGFNTRIHGLAFNKALCTSNRVAEVEDTAGSYKLIDIVTHELGHSCGSGHDGDRSSNPPCDPQAGHIMSPVAHGLQNSKFSDCSKSEIGRYMRTLSQACVAVTWRVNRLQNVTDLPGTGTNTSVFCQRLHPNGGYSGQPTGDYPQCKVYCFNPLRNGWAYESMLDGMQCGAGKICLRGDCVTTPKYYQPSGRNRGD